MGFISQSQPKLRAEVCAVSESPGGMGAAARPAPALRQSPTWPESAGGEWTDEHEGPSRGVALEDRARKGHRSDLPARAAGQAAEAAGPRTGGRSGIGQRAGADRGELDGGPDLDGLGKTTSSIGAW